MIGRKFPAYGALPARYRGYENSRVVILPVPFDRTSSWQKGARRGPAALLAASAHMELFDLEAEAEWYLTGIHTAGPVRAFNSQRMVDRVRTRTEKYIKDDKFVVVLGGEHTVALGSIYAHHRQWPRLSVLHLDAHGDNRKSYNGKELSHACVVARIREKNIPVVSAGVRSMDAGERRGPRRETLITAHRILHSKGWQEELIAGLGPDVYITLDLDVLDPGIMPSTGTPEPGGLQWYPLLDLLKTVASCRRIRGFDLVELRPTRNPAPDFLAAKLVYKMIGFALGRLTEEAGGPDTGLS